MTKSSHHDNDAMTTYSVERRRDRSSSKHHSSSNNNSNTVKTLALVPYIPPPQYTSLSTLSSSSSVCSPHHHHCHRYSKPYNKTAPLLLPPSTTTESTTTIIIAEDIIPQILSYLDAITLTKSISLTCKSWNALSKCNTIWRNLCISKFGIDVNELIPAPNPTKGLYVISYLRMREAFYGDHVCAMMGMGRRRRGDNNVISGAMFRQFNNDLQR